MQQNTVQSDNIFPTLCSSIAIAKDKTQLVSVLGGDIYSRKEAGEWEKAVEGLPHHTIVNRLKQDGDDIYACTNKGLFLFHKNGWKPMDVMVPCYHYMSAYGCGFAATEYGIWCGVAGSWARTDISDAAVYDFLYLSQFLFYAHQSGVTMYDRYTDEWAEFPLNHAVTSLAVYRGNIFGTTSQGELVQGDGHGRLTAVRFQHHYIYSLIQKGNAVFACSDRGLFQLRLFRGQVALVSITLGSPIVDVDICDDEMYMATLFHGVQRKKISAH